MCRCGGSSDDIGLLDKLIEKTKKLIEKLKEIKKINLKEVKERLEKQGAEKKNIQLLDIFQLEDISSITDEQKQQIKSMDVT